MSSGERDMRTILLAGQASSEMTSLEEILKRYHYTVMKRPDGLSALDAMRSTMTADLVITDHRLPDMDGLEFLNALRRMSPNIPVILLAARGSMDIEEYLIARSLGAHAYIMNLVRARNLGRIITAIVTRGNTVGMQHSP
jgi:CheY-like chemotaxis protein